MRFKTLIIFLVIIGLLAAFYMPGIPIIIKSASYEGTCSPYNLDWSGTSTLVHRLRREGYTVIITGNKKELQANLGREALLLIVAPDKALTSNNTPINDVVRSFRRGLLNIAVFDENTTSNNLLSSLGVRVNGKMILDPTLQSTPQYPLTRLFLPNRSSVFVRLNWASYIEVSGANVYTLSVTFGIVDDNDNGKIDPEEIEKYGGGAPWLTGIIAESGNNTELLVMSDSSPLINSELDKNLTVSMVMYQYIKLLADKKNKTIIIPNYIYRRKDIKTMIPFHSSILFLLFADYIKSGEEYLNKIAASIPLLNTLIAITLLLTILYALKKTTNISLIEEYKPSKINEYSVIIESMITSNLLDKRFLKRKEKQLINRFWDLLVNVYEKAKGVNLLDVAGRKISSTYLIQKNITDKDIKKITWLYKVFLKASGKKRLPIILRWRSTLLKYIELTEYFLNKTGYTIFGKEGYKDARYVIK